VLVAAVTTFVLGAAAIAGREVRWLRLPCGWLRGV